MSDTGNLITRVYGGFKGVDFRSEETFLTRSPDCLNVWRDYKEAESIRTRPGMKLEQPFESTIYGLFFFNDMLVVHSGKKLYKVQNGDTSVVFAGANAAPSFTFVYDNVLYFKDGKNYLKYDGTTISEVEGYIPTTSIARKPSGGGKIYEDVNMLQSKRINTFLADGESKEFVLDAKNLDGDYPPIVKVNDKVISDDDYSVDYTAGKITFRTAPAVPKTDGQDNVSIQFSKTNVTYKGRILNSTLLQVFDNRVFFSGNKDYPNTVWHCSLDDPSYCSDLDYYNEGLDRARVKGLVAGNNALWVFREPSPANTTVFYHTPTVDSEYGKIYPSQHSSVTTGCVGKAINFNDDIVFFSERGMEGISGDVTTEQVVAHRSTLVDRRLVVEKDYENMILAEWEGYLLVFVGKSVYLADSRAMFTNELHNEYEWLYWVLEKEITCAVVYEGVLYLGTHDGLYTLSDYEADIESYWTTPLDKFKYPHKLKTTNKRGCVVECTGDIDVYVKTDKEDWTIAGTYKNVEDDFVCRIKKKKFKDIRLKFYSNTRFSLETATLESFIGGYIKR